MFALLYSERTFFSVSSVSFCGSRRVTRRSAPRITNTGAVTISYADYKVMSSDTISPSWISIKKKILILLFITTL